VKSEKLKVKREVMERKEKKAFWGYSESFFVAFEIMILGFIVEIFLKGQGVRTPHFPYNLYLVLALTVSLLLVHFRFRQRPLIKWLSSIPCSVSAISVYAILVLLLGFIPQEESDAGWLQVTGLNHLKNSWPFLFIELYLMISLGLVVLRRGIPFRLKNLGFLLNHLGLWLTLVAAGLGSGDLKRVTIDLYEGRDFSHDGIVDGQSRYELPFDLKLLDFNIELYNPKIAIADRSAGKLVEAHGETLPLIEKGFEGRLIDWNVAVKEYIPFAMETEPGYKASDRPGSMAVAYVQTRNLISGDTVSGWITSGSILFEPRYLDLNNTKVLILTEPEPRKFESVVAIRNAQGEADTVKLEVNKPYRIKGWKLYQISYDTSMGRHSTLSVIEAVRDPWLPLVYTGIIMLLGGALYLFWLGRGMRSE
jgi:hypothetical protein